jgi:hypothetical protein
VSDERRNPPADDADFVPLDPGLERALAEALRSAWAPQPLDPALHEQLIEAALEDPLAPPSESELVESARLRDALAGQGAHPDADLARALRNAGAPAPLPAQRAHELVKSATLPRRAGNVLFVTFGAAAITAMAAAAAVMLLVFPAAERSADDAPAAATLPGATAFAQSRSTAALFSEKFETATTSDRIDRIADARSRELRQNRYAQWGLR